MRVTAPLLLVVSLWLPATARAQSRHPLDALTFAEHWVVYDVIRDSGNCPTPGVSRASRSSSLRKRTSWHGPPELRSRATRRRS